jgi:hypothetical protein
MAGRLEISMNAAARIARAALARRVDGREEVWVNRMMCS